MTQLKINRVDSERFGMGNRMYFFDINKTIEEGYYLAITRCDAIPGAGYKRRQVIVHEDEFNHFVEALAMLLGRYSHGESGSGC